MALTWAGRGHTDGDICVHIADADAMFIGDLVEKSADPSFGGDCWPLEWSDTLTCLSAGSVPRASSCLAGTPVDAAFVERQRDDIELVARVIRERHAQDWTLESAVSEPDHRLPYPLAGLETAIRRG